MELHEIRQSLSSGKSIFDLDLRVSYYTRVSTSFEDQLNSLKSQTSYYDEYIKSIKNWTLIEGYVDEGLSGTSVKARKAFNKMINDAKNKKFDLLITKEVSRFARNTLDSIYYTRDLLSNGVGVFFQNDNINTLMPDSELRLTIMASMAQEESRKVSERVKWGKKRKVESGRIHTTGRINGYDIVDKKYVINEKEAEMIRMIFNMYCDGVGFRRIGDSLYDKGYKNEEGNKYGYSTLKRILTNPRYKGYFTANQSVTVDFLTKKVVHLPEEEWVMYYDPEQVPPIVSEEIWDKANKILQEKSEKIALKHETSYQNKYKYSGKIICKEHQVPFYRSKYRYKSGDKEVWMCKEYQSKGKAACNLPVLYTNEIDNILSVVFNKTLVNKENYYDKFLNIVKKHINENDFDKDIKKIEKEIDLINKKKDKLLDLVVNDMISNQEFKNRNDEYNLLINDKEEQINKYNSILKGNTDIEKKIYNIKNFLEQEYEFNGNIGDEVINLLVERIDISKGDVENTINVDITLKYGKEIKTVYSKDFSLSLIKHHEGDKMMLRIPRKINERGGNYDIIVNINNISLLVA